MASFNLITTRPAAVEDRLEPGHWEGDLIIGANNASAIVTLVERTSRFNLLGNLDDGYSADAVLACLVELFDRVPSDLARTLTLGPGQGDGRPRQRAEGSSGGNVAIYAAGFW